MAIDDVCTQIIALYAIMIVEKTLLLRNRCAFGTICAVLKLQLI